MAAEIRLWDVPRDGTPVDCRGCGAKIIWGKTPKGKNIPLSITNVNARWMGEGQSSICVQAPAHFADCPKSQEFSGRNR